MDLAFADDAFDLVACQFGVMFLPDKVTRLPRGTPGARAPGGLFLFNAWDTLDTHEVEAAVIDVAGRVLAEDPPDFSAGPARVRRPRPDPRRRPGRGAPFKGLVAQRARGMSPSAAALAEGYCLGTPLRFELQERGDLADLVPRVTAAMTRRLGTGAVEGRLRCLVIRAVKPG